MNKITIKKIPFKLLGELVELGKKLNFKAINTDLTVFNLNDVKGTKIISVFPDINTSVCDEQTQVIARLASKNPELNFISVSTDTSEVQSKWCAAHNIENIEIVSDAKLKEFGIVTNLLISKISKLHRAFIILNDDNIILDIITNPEVTADPDYAALEEWVLKLNKK